MEADIKKQLIKSVESIKRKVKQLRDQEDKANFKVQKLFKPITDPLNALVDNNTASNKTFTEKASEDTEDSASSIDTVVNLSTAKKYDDFEDCDDNEYKYEKSPDKTYNPLEMTFQKEDIIDIYDGINIPFGVRSENKNLMMGKSAVKLSKIENHLNNDKTYIMNIDSNRKYELTPGLIELLLRKKPNLTIVSDKDKLVYKDMLHYTCAHKRDYNPKNQLKGDKGTKYREIIKPLFTETFDMDKIDIESRNEPKSGGSLPKLKRYKSKTDLIYWDDPNELIERLKLLIASRNAGNSNHDNEIISIIEELKEAGIIKS